MLNVHLPSIYEQLKKTSDLAKSVQDAHLADDSRSKEDRSPVTVADLGIQALLQLNLNELTPEVPLMGEEDQSTLQDDETLRKRVTDLVEKQRPGTTESDVMNALNRSADSGGSNHPFWVVDPIDGTKGFLRGGQYAIALALIEKGRPVAGFLGCPNLPPNGRLFGAQTGEGSTRQNTSDTLKENIFVAPPKSMAEARFCESVESGHSDQGLSARIALRLGVSQEPCRIDSQCKYAMVAQGEASFYLRLPTRPDYQEKIWDHAAGCILVEEAGGTVTDIHGKILDFSLGTTLAKNQGVVASAGPYHDELIAAIQIEMSL